MTEEEQVKKMLRKRERWKDFWRLLIPIVVFLCIASILTYLTVFANTWQVSVEEYEDVDYDWDDDHDRYDVFIPEIGHLYIRTSSAQWVFLPDDSTINYACVVYSENIAKTKSNYTLTKFYINVGWRGEE